MELAEYAYAIPPYELLNRISAAATLSNLVRPKFGGAQDEINVSASPKSNCIGGIRYLFHLKSYCANADQRGLDRIQ